MHAGAGIHARGNMLPQGQEELDSDESGFSMGWILGNDRRFLLLSGNYRPAATDRTEEALEAHRDT
jgi:hypothetical protein